MDDTVSREGATERHGDNLYPARLACRFGPHELDLDVPEGVWNPTPHGITLGNALVEDLRFDGDHVLELGTGCGVHAILLAARGASRLTVTEIDEAPLECARHNLEKHGAACPIEYLIADWTHVPGGPFDALVANPPFAKSGRRYRRHFIDTLVLAAPDLVRSGGRLVFVQSSMADIPRSIRLMEECGMRVRIVREVDQPFRQYYFEDSDYLLEMARIPGSYTIRDGRHYERLVVFEAHQP